jgi:two-component system LytT family response regulator
LCSGSSDSVPPSERSAPSPDRVVKERSCTLRAQDYCVLVHIARTSYLLRDSIRRLEPRLAAHGFIRVHRSALVNLARVRELQRPTQRDWYLVLDDGTELPVSRRLRPEIQRQLGRLGESP